MHTNSEFGWLREPWFGIPEDDVEEEEDRPKAGDAVGVWLMPDGQPVPPASPAIPSMADGRVAVGRAGLPTPFEFVIGRMSAGPVFR